MSQTIVSIPSPLRGPLGTRIPGLLTSDQVFRKLLESARRSLKIEYSEVVLAGIR